VTDAPVASPGQTGPLGRAALGQSPAVAEQAGPLGQATPGQPAALPGSAADVEQTVCSRAGCRDQAIWALRWRNPRIHAADRRKIWVACDEHVVYLREFLSARDFPVEVAALAARPE
jgi:hypothetical protein